MDNIELSKHYNVELSSLSNKLVRNKDINIFRDDDITLDVTVTSKDNLGNIIPKDLTGTTIVLYCLRPEIEEKEPTLIEQKEGIELVDATNGKVSIKLDKKCLLVNGMCIYHLFITDLDESIYTSKSTFNVIDNLTSNIMADIQDEVQSLVELVALLDESKRVIENVGSKCEDMITNVENKVIESDNNINTLVDNTEANIVKLENRINNTNTVIDEQLIKTIPLIPLRKQGSQFYYFFTDKINIKASELLKRQYIISCSGSCIVNNKQSQVGFLNFSLEGDQIVGYYSYFLDKLISNTRVGLNFMFDNQSNKIGKDVIGYKIGFNSNILQSLNTDGDTYCYMTPLAIANI